MDPFVGVAVLTEVSLEPWFLARESLKGEGFGVLGAGEGGPSRVKERLVGEVMSFHLLWTERLITALEKKRLVPRRSIWQGSEGQAASLVLSLTPGLNSGLVLRVLTSFCFTFPGFNFIWVRSLTDAGYPFSIEWCWASSALKKACHFLSSSYFLIVLVNLATTNFPFDEKETNFVYKIAFQLYQLCDEACNTKKKKKQRNKNQILKWSCQNAFTSTGKSDQFPLLVLVSWIKLSAGDPRLKLSAISQ